MRSIGSVKVHDCAAPLVTPLDALNPLSKAMGSGQVGLGGVKSDAFFCKPDMLRILREHGKTRHTQLLSRWQSRLRNNCADGNRGHAAIVPCVLKTLSRWLGRRL